jgi:ribonuclease HII
MPDLTLEWQLQQRGYRLVAGVDEAGRGPLAGPVVAAAVILPPQLTGKEPWLQLVNDSKRLSPLQRQKAAQLIRENALALAVAGQDAGQIDELGIGNATVRAMLEAVAKLRVRPHYLLMDFVHIRECPWPFQTVVKGDSLSYSISAASILAKTERDRLMRGLDEVYPGYCFAQHKGYPTPQHLAQLSALGPCPEHRRSFAPVRRALESRKER